MKLDRTVKMLLATIVLLLGIIVLRPSIGPTPASAQTPIPEQEEKFGHLVVNTDGNYISFFDSRTGSLYLYSGKRFKRHLRVTEMGKDLELVK